MRNIFIGVIITSIAIASVFAVKLHAAKDKNEAMVSQSKNKTKGSEISPIRIVEFSDFQCPACRAALIPLHALMEKYPGKIQVIYKHFPLRMHKHAALAHQSAECANSQGAFWPYHDMLFESQPVWSGSEDPMKFFLRYAKDAELNMEEFSACLVDESITDAIFSEKKEGQDLLVKSTPTFFLNGVMIAGGKELEKRGDEIIQNILGE